MHHPHLHNLIISFRFLGMVLLSLSVSEINKYLTTVGLVVSISYGIRKFYLLEKNKDKKQ